MTLEEKEKAIIEHYGLVPQLKYFQTEIFELNESIINYENFKNINNECDFYDENNIKYLQNNIIKDHIVEEIADVQMMLNQFINYYDISYEEIFAVMNYKADRQLKRIEQEKGE